MATLEQKIDKKSLQTLENHKKNGKVVAAKIFDNMLRKANKSRLALSIKDNRIKQIRIEILGGKIWVTPYIHNNKLFLNQGLLLFKGEDIFGKSVNKV
jgi:hypothetical protein